MGDERNLYRTVRIIMCVETLSWFEVKVPRIRPSTAGVPSRRGEVSGYGTFLPQRWQIHKIMKNYGLNVTIVANTGGE